MKFEVFEKIVTTLQAQQQKSYDLCRFGIDLINFEEGYSETISLLFRAYYGSDGADWIDWYMYERDPDSGDLNQAHDADGNPICYDIRSLWQTVEEIRVSVDFEEYILPAPRKPPTPADLDKFFGKFL
jgi:hypothetical protein